MRKFSKGMHAPAGALLAAVALTLAGCGLGMTAEQRVDKAREYMGGGNYPAAIIELKNALQDDPVNVPARVLLAEASHRAGDHDSAVKEFERSIDLGADIEAFRLDLADAMVRSGRAEQALATADPAKVPAGERGRAELIRAQSLAALGRLDEAEAALEVARRDPGQALDADLMRARVALARNQPDAAREIIDGLGGAGEQRSEYWETLANIQIMEGDREAAVESYRKAIDTVDESFGARRFILLGSLAETLLSIGNVDEARRISERLHRDARQHPLPNYLMSRVEYQSGNFQQALAYAQALLSVQSGSSIGNTLAGAATLAMNQPAQAESYLTRAVEADPGNATARKLLAQTRLGLGSPQDALAALAPIAGTDREATALAGMASIRAGDPEAAIELFGRELANDPDNDNVRMQLVVSLMAAGRNDEALAELGMMKGLDDVGQLRADLIEVAVHIQAGDLAEARATASELAGTRPADPQVRNSLGALFLAAGQVGDAQRWFDESTQLDPGNAAAEFNLGRIAAAAGRSVEAEARFNAVLVADPGNAAAKTALAQLAWSDGRRGDAIRRLEELRAGDARALLPRIMLSQYLQADGRGAEALTVAREAAAAHPDNVEAVSLLGGMLLDAGQPAEALRAFERAIDLQPGNARLFLNRARAHVLAGDLDAARRDLRNVLTIDPDSTQARLALIDLERRTGRLDEAAEQLALVKRQMPGDDPAVSLLEGELLLAQREPAAAIAPLERAMAGGIGGRAAVGLYQARLQAGQPDAIRTLEDALAANPDDVVVRVLAADQHLSLGNFDQAVRHYEVLLRVQPDNPAMLNNLAWLYNRKGDGRAQATAERALELAPESPHVMDTLGWILHQRGNTTRALELISRAAELAPDVAEIRYHHAVLLAETGEKDRAAREALAVLADETAVQYHAQAQALLERLGR